MVRPSTTDVVERRAQAGERAARASRRARRAWPAARRSACRPRRRRRRRRRRGCPGPRGQRTASTVPGGRQEAALGVLGVDARLDRVAAQQHVALLELERPAGGDLELAAHEVDARHQLGDGVLDLDARVHLEEVPAAVGREQELGRAGADVADRLGEPQRGGAELAAQVAPDAGRGRLLDHLLVAALHASSRARPGGGPSPWASRRICTSTWRAPLDVALVDETAVAERRLGLARAPPRPRSQLVGVAHDAHAAAASARARP